MYTIEELRDRLPKVGDLVLRKPVLYGTDPKKVKKRWARVIYVHDKNLWYTVEFDINGHKVKQGFNLLEQIKCKTQEVGYPNVFTPDDKFEYVYDGSSSTLHKVPKKRYNPFIPNKLNDITYDLEVYNRKHGTRLTYGMYVHMLEEEQKKLLRSKKNAGRQ